MGEDSSDFEIGEASVGKVVSEISNSGRCCFVVGSVCNYFWNIYSNEAATGEKQTAKFPDNGESLQNNSGKFH